MTEPRRPYAAVQRLQKPRPKLRPIRCTCNKRLFDIEGDGRGEIVIHTVCPRCGKHFKFQPKRLDPNGKSQ